MKCVVCGEDAVLNNLCAECYLKGKPLLPNIQGFNIKVCFHCKRFYLKGVWKDYEDLDFGIKDLIFETIKKFLKDNTVDIQLNLPEFVFKPGIKTQGSVILTVTTNILGKLLSEEYEKTLNVEFMKCPHCSKIGTQYFEGVLQIRNPDEETLALIEKAFEKNVDRGLVVSKTEHLKDGIDYYISSKRFISQFCQSLYNRFGGDFKLSARLFSKDRTTSKDVYRVNAFLRLPDFKIGDIVKISNFILQIGHVKGSMLHGIDLRTEKSTSIDYKNNPYEIVCKKSDFLNTIVSKVKPHLEVLDPETYQSVIVKNKADVKHGEKVKVVKIDGYIYIVF